MNWKLYSLILLGMTSLTLRAQDVAFSQYYAMPVQLNPAMAGTANKPRFSIAYRNQWPGLGSGTSGGFVTYAGSFDMHFERIKSSIGASFASDRIANNFMVSNSAALDWAVQIRLNKKLALRGALEGSYTNRYVDWYRLLLGDQINQLSGFYQSFQVPNPTNEITPSSFNKNIFDMGTGLLLFSNKYYGGIAVKHLLRPNEALQGHTVSRIPVLFTLHAGAMLPFKARHIKHFYLSPNALYTHQANFNQINVGMLLNVSLIYGGIWYRNNIRNSDAVIFVLGVRKGIFRAGYSYDLTLSKLAGSTGGTHEVTMTFSIGKDDNSLSPHSRSGILSCPEILKF